MYITDRLILNKKVINRWLEEHLRSLFASEGVYKDTYNKA